MIWLTVGVVALIALLAIAYVVRPLWQPRRRLHETDDTPLAELLAKKDEVLRAIKELEFDYQTKKLSETDFQRDNARLRQQAVVLMKRIEEVAPQSDDLDAELESLIAQQRRVDDPVQKNGTEKSETKAEGLAAARFCPECGTPAEPDDNFCARCGTPLQQAVAQE